VLVDTSPRTGPHRREHLNVGLPVVDEMRFGPTSRAEASLFPRLVSYRYGRGSITDIKGRSCRPRDLEQAVGLKIVTGESWCHKARAWQPISPWRVSWLSLDRRRGVPAACWLLWWMDHAV
jgi:hypothetical protein